MVGYTHEQMAKAKEIYERAYGHKFDNSVDVTRFPPICAILYAMGVTEITQIIDDNFVIIRHNYNVENYETIDAAQENSSSDDKARVIIPSGRFDF